MAGEQGRERPAGGGADWTEGGAGEGGDPSAQVAGAGGQGGAAVHGVPQRRHGDTAQDGETSN